VPSLPRRKPPLGTRQHTPESAPEFSKARTNPSKAGSLSLLRTAVATALLSWLLSSPGWSRHSRFTRVLRRERKMNMGGFQGGWPSPKLPLTPSQAGAGPVTERVTSVTAFVDRPLILLFTNCGSLCSCTATARTLSRPKPDPTLDFSQTMLFPARHLERMLPIDGIAKLPKSKVRAQKKS